MTLEAAAKFGQYLPFLGGKSSIPAGGVQGIPAGGSEGGKTGGQVAEVGAVWGGDSYGNINVTDATYNRISAIDGELSPKQLPNGNRHLAWA